MAAGDTDAAASIVVAVAIGDTCEKALVGKHGVRAVNSRKKTGYHICDDA